MTFDLYLGYRVSICANSFRITRTAYVIKMKLGMDEKYINRLWHQFYHAILRSGGDNWRALKFVQNLDVGLLLKTMVLSQIKLCVIIATIEVYAAITYLVTFTQVTGSAYVQNRLLYVCLHFRCLFYRPPSSTIESMPLHPLPAPFPPSHWEIIFWDMCIFIFIV